MAKSREELLRERVQTQIADQRAKHLENAAQLLDKAGSIIATAMNRVGAGNVTLEDVRALCSASAMLSGVANHMVKAIETLSVQPVQDGGGILLKN